MPNTYYTTGRSTSYSNSTTRPTLKSTSQSETRSTSYSASRSTAYSASRSTSYSASRSTGYTAYRNTGYSYSYNTTASASQATSRSTAYTTSRNTDYVSSWSTSFNTNYNSSYSVSTAYSTSSTTSSAFVTSWSTNTSRNTTLYRNTDRSTSHTTTTTWDYQVATQYPSTTITTNTDVERQTSFYELDTSLPVTSNLVMYFDSRVAPSGTTWTDLSPTGNNGTFNSTPSLVTVDASKPSVLFNGKVFTIPNNSAYNFANQTLFFFTRPTNRGAGRQNIWDQTYAGEGTITQETAGTMSYYNGNGTQANSGNYIGSSGYSAVNNSWDSWAIVRGSAGTTNKWYKNGVLNSSTSNPYNPGNGTNNIRVGYGYTGVYWQGSMAAMLAYTRALSASEVLQLHNNFQNKFNFT